MTHKVHLIVGVENLMNAPGKTASGMTIDESDDPIRVFVYFPKERPIVTGICTEKNTHLPEARNGHN